MISRPSGSCQVLSVRLSLRPNSPHSQQPATTGQPTSAIPSMALSPRHLLAALNPKGTGPPCVLPFYSSFHVVGHRNHVCVHKDQVKI